ncbi:hypothetical protein C4D60_Mb11t08790 [Musa balbisiana]|uniref:Uncharacterized protein n=1 Tax=Musa balbisiana TaxID=52838 RepID=A0A4S8J3M4_MUSBA|nr:hypothetical protein C4D60_Mb11t08790 [Musa balbisiana]
MLKRAAASSRGLAAEGCTDAGEGYRNFCSNVECMRDFAAMQERLLQRGGRNLCSLQRFLQRCRRDFCSNAGEIYKVGDSCSNAVLEFGGRKSGGVFSGRLRLAREQQPAIETKAATVLPLGALPTEEVSISRKCYSRLQRMATAEGRRHRHERDGQAVVTATQGEVVDSCREAVVGLWWKVTALD